jgi:exodeoxyribonuclease-3
MRLISWNVHGRVRSLAKQSEALHQRCPDVVALQEIRPTTVAHWREQLAQSGLPYSVDSFVLQNSSLGAMRRRQYGEILASRWPLSPLPPLAFPVPWPERVLSALLQSPWGTIEVHTTGIPPGVSNGWLKVEMFEGIYTRLACPTPLARILCGDLNTPQAESADGRVTTWGQDIMPDGRARIWKSRNKFGYIDAGTRWDAAERNVLTGLAQFDLADVFRTLHGYGVVECSWYWKAKGRCIGRRFDHVFASRRLSPVRCVYLHALREMGLSDHSPIAVDFIPEETLQPTVATAPGGLSLPN